MRKAAAESVSPFWLRDPVISRLWEARQTPLGLNGTLLPASILEAGRDSHSLCCVWRWVPEGVVRGMVWGHLPGVMG